MSTTIRCSSSCTIFKSYEGFATVRTQESDGTREFWRSMNRRTSVDIGLEVRSFSRSFASCDSRRLWISSLESFSSSTNRSVVDTCLAADTPLMLRVERKACVVRGTRCIQRRSASIDVGTFMVANLQRSLSCMKGECCCFS